MSLDSLGPEIASAMLYAMISSGPSTLRNNSLPIDEQKRYLIKNINSLPKHDKQAIGRIVTMNNQKQLLQDCSEGTVVNLDLLSNSAIEQMYNLMVHKVNVVI